MEEEVKELLTRVVLKDETIKILVSRNKIDSQCSIRFLSKTQITNKQHNLTNALNDQIDGCVGGGMKDEGRRLPLEHCSKEHSSPLSLRLVCYLFNI